MLINSLQMGKAAKNDSGNLSDFLESTAKNPDLGGF